jgi:branched-chain amino acid transport system ATP-binding protein
LLELNQITVYYDKAMALQNISMVVEEGEIVSVIGGNGAGKSTLVRAVSGLKKLTSGEIIFQKKRIDILPPHKIVKKGISQCPERWRIAPEMTVLENLELGAYLIRDKEEKQKRFERVFSLFPVLKERRKQQGGTLSGGERQMLSIGRALMAEPKFLILDEPSLGLAPVLKEKIFESIYTLKERLTILLVEQDTKLALGIANRAYIIENGRLIREGESKSLLEDDLVKKAYLGI